MKNGNYRLLKNRSRFEKIILPAANTYNPSTRRDLIIICKWVILKNENRAFFLQMTKASRSGLLTRKTRKVLRVTCTHVWVFYWATKPKGARPEVDLEIVVSTRLYPLRRWLPWMRIISPLVIPAQFLHSPVWN